jgi:hypothetical protein
MIPKALALAIDRVLLADSQQQHWLGPAPPAFEVSMSDALTFYGGAPSAKFDLWCNCRAVHGLRQVMAEIAAEALVTAAAAAEEE